MRYKDEYKGKRRRNPEQNLKNCLSSNCSLELGYMKSESLVIVNQDVTVNDTSNFAHTAHHARRVVTALNLVLHYTLLSLSSHDVLSNRITYAELFVRVREFLLIRCFVFEC